MGIEDPSFIFIIVYLDIYFIVYELVFARSLILFFTTIFKNIHGAELSYLL